LTTLHAPADAAPDPADVAGLLDRSGERDTWIRRLLASWREGYAAGARERFSEGYAAAVADIKRAEHELVDVIRLASRRARPGGGAWLAEVERHGGTEFGGIGKPRVPVPPEVIEQARRDLGRTAR